MIFPLVITGVMIITPKGCLQKKKSSYGGKLVILNLPPPPPRQVGNKKEGNLLKVADPLPPYGSREYFLLQ